MNMKIQMKNDFILVKEIKEERVSEGGIILPIEKYHRTAEVLAVPEGSDIKIGDIVLKTIGNETTYTLNGEEVKTLHRDKIFVILNGPEA